MASPSAAIRRIGGHFADTLIAIDFQSGLAMTCEVSSGAISGMSPVGVLASGLGWHCSSLSSALIWVLFSRIL